MNSRERVLTTLNHREPDRVPFDMGGTVVTGIHHKAYVALRRALELPEREPVIIDMIQQLAQVDDDVMDCLGVDMRNISPRSSATFQIQIGDMGEYTFFYDEFGIGWRSPKDGGYYYDMFDHPLRGDITVDQVEKFILPDPLDPARFVKLPSACATSSSGRWCSATSRPASSKCSPGCEATRMATPTGAQPRPWRRS
jgi:uroporphyrinogen decarboxylase